MHLFDTKDIAKEYHVFSKNNCVISHVLNQNDIRKEKELLLFLDFSKRNFIIKVVILNFKEDY